MLYRGLYPKYSLWLATQGDYQARTCSARSHDEAQRLGLQIAMSSSESHIASSATARSYAPSGSPAYRVVKRAFDIALSAGVLVVGFVPGAILAAAIAVQAKASPIYVQERIGKNGKRFNLIKYRSMVPDADDVEKYFTSEQMEAWEAERKVDNDPRITPIGRFIRKTSIDEIPQFINVLKGDMSAIGPRPIVDEELQWLGDDVDEFLSVRPGITGWWQVTERNDAEWENGERQKLELYYVRNRSLGLDLQVFFRTIGAMVSGTGK